MVTDVHQVHLVKKPPYPPDDRKILKGGETVLRGDVTQAPNVTARMLVPSALGPSLCLNNP